MGPITHLYTGLGEPCLGPRAELTVGHLEVARFPLFSWMGSSGFQGSLKAS